jgi:hypothetical protein
MRQGLLLVSSVLFSACSSTESSDPATDYGPNFAGIWVGTITETDTSTGTDLGSFEAALNIEETSRNYLKINNLCIEAQGPQVMATSNTDFSGSFAYVCPVVADEECGTVVVTWVSISGNLSGSSLLFTGNLSAARCGRNDRLSAVLANGARVTN